VLPYVAAALAFVIFIFDTITDLEIAGAVFYVIVVLMSVGFCRRRGVILVSAGCMGLTLLSYFLTPTGSLQSGLINCIISLSAIGATTYLALKIESAEVAAHEARAQLAHIARVTTLGELTASIAHEVNQPLAAVVTSGDACLRWLAGQPPNLDKAKQSIERMVNDANRASEIIARVRKLAKGAPPEKDRLSINDAIEEILGLISGEIDQNGILIQRQLSDDLPQVLGDRIQLQQVVLNLVVNAMEALRSIEQGRRQLLVRSERRGLAEVLVTISDFGPGLDPGKLDNMFDAFYTTKRDGIGIGLTISRTIIEFHGGRIWAEPNSPQGATIQFTLPVGGDNGP
jgi:C4-dicarboxylate-specific signal transduction histidine kinase